MVVAEQLLNLAEVGARTQQLRRKDMSQGVRSDALSIRDARGTRVAQEGLGQDRLREAPAVDTEEERALRGPRPGRKVLREQWNQGGVDRYNPGPPFLGAPDPEQPALEVDVLPV